MSEPTKTDLPVITEDSDCCEIWPLIAGGLRWRSYDHQRDMCTMPHINGTDGNHYFVNFCPSCGKSATNRNMLHQRIEP